MLIQLDVDLVELFGCCFELLLEVSVVIQRAEHVGKHLDNLAMLVRLLRPVISNQGENATDQSVFELQL